MNVICSCRKDEVSRLHTADKNASGYRLGLGIWSLQTAVDAIITTGGEGTRLVKLLAIAQRPREERRRRLRLAKEKETTQNSHRLGCSMCSSICS